MDEKSKKKQRNYLASAITAAILIPLYHWIWPGIVPLSTAQIWDYHGTGLGDWLILGAPVLLWGFVAGLFGAILGRGRSRASTGTLFVGGTLISIWAGVVEEVCFRWLIFLGSCGTLWVINYLLFGFAGFGIPEWIHLNVFGPIANYVTFGYLKQWLLGSPWQLGAALLSANAFFRDGHAYQGWFGVLNSWVIGMFLFYVMLSHGLLAAIVIHFTYDFIIFTVRAFFQAE